MHVCDTGPLPARLRIYGCIRKPPASVCIESGCAARCAVPDVLRVSNDHVSLLFLRYTGRQFPVLINRAGSRLYGALFVGAIDPNPYTLLDQEKMLDSSVL